MENENKAMSDGASMLARAQSLAGGIEALARALRVPKKQLGDWISGEIETPHGVFLRVVAFLRGGQPQA